jgi:hypothetical protein
MIFFECIHWWGIKSRLKAVLQHLSRHGYIWWKIGYEIVAFRVAT